MWIGIDRPPRRWVGGRDEEAKQIFRRKVDPRHRHRRGGMFRPAQIEIKWGISAAPKKGEQSGEWKHSPGNMCGETAPGRLEQRNGRAPPRPIHQPAGEPLPHRGNRNVGSREALHSAGASPDYRTFHAVVQLTKLLRDERQQHAQLLECVLKDGPGVNTSCY